MPSIVWELKRQAAEDDLVERARHDIRRIEKRCRQIAFEHNQRARQRKKRRPVKMKTFRTQLREIESFREDRNDNQNLIDKVNLQFLSFKDVIVDIRVVRSLLSGIFWLSGVD